MILNSNAADKIDRLYSDIPVAKDIDEYHGNKSEMAVVVRRHKF